MLYVDFNAGGKDYKLRINTRATVTLEKKLGCNPIAIFGNGDRIPTITEMVSILHSALQQYEHNITLDDTYDIFDSWLNDGHIMTDFISVIVEVYKASGMMKDKKDKENTESDDEKN